MLLEDLLDQIKSITPFQNNVLVCFISIFYFKICSEGISQLQHKFKVNALYCKPFTYMALSTTVILWPFYDTSDWSWRLNAVVPSAVLLRCVYKGAIQKDPEDHEVQTLSRSSSPSELLFGPTQYAFVLVVIGLYRFMTGEAALLIAAVGVGDAFAPITGHLYGRHVYHMPLCSPKTMEGSVCGVFMGTCMATYCLCYAFALDALPLRLVLAYAAIAAIVEGTAPGNTDNLLVPAVLHVSMDRVQQWLPA